MKAKRETENLKRKGEEVSEYYCLISCRLKILQKFNTCIKEQKPYEPLLNDSV